MLTSREKEGGRGGGEKGLLCDYMYHVCETFENCKALQNLKSLSLS